MKKPKDTVPHFNIIDKRNTETEWIRLRSVYSTCCKKLVSLASII